MLIIPVKDGESIDRARQQFIKPSVTLRQARLKAAHKQRALSKEEQA